jgi:hypothetical protein
VKIVHISLYREEMALGNYEVMKILMEDAKINFVLVVVDIKSKNKFF